MFLAALLSTFPGYYVAVALIDKIARLRSTCHTISAASGTVGAIATAYGVQNLNLKGDMAAIKKLLTMLAIANLLGFFFTFLIPETMGRSLEEISGEDDNSSIGADAAEMSTDET
ncbi:Inorganic phosphate transporter 1-11 [Dichanthelium oligosanthes]|uniref:Inorganic phosphate transporter 1-11 n=1 Tax=Dichanthelium oligosanthes TaxID=888268 RepID=A0A1E5VHD0_9POAL|nr:Inorganic phosphate transporter 1-11 [Dichanthelium oligosanthes]